MVFFFFSHLNATTCSKFHGPLGPKLTQRANKAKMVCRIVTLTSRLAKKNCKLFCNYFIKEKRCNSWLALFCCKVLQRLVFLSIFSSTPQSRLLFSSTHNSTFYQYIGTADGLLSLLPFDHALSPVYVFVSY